MTRREKHKFIGKHFWRQCRVVLTDVKKTKYYKRLQDKYGTISEVSDVSYRRKKHSCYICFEKFYSKEDLATHKSIHFCEKSNDTFSDDNEEDAKNLNAYNQLNNLIVESYVGSAANTIETGEHARENSSHAKCMKQTSAETEISSKETNYKCLKCNVYFLNQEDVKTHPHNQYFCKYYCTQCQRQFNTKGGFIVHVLQHDITKVSKLSFRCNKCPFSFDDCHNLKRHYATAHNIHHPNTAQYAENIVNRDNIQVDVNSSNETTSEDIEIHPSPVSTENTHETMLDRLRKNSKNPITGNIPIFDCNVCYDVFASYNALKRHTVLHQELENNSDNNVSILIEDDDIQFIQEDDTSDKHRIVSNFMTTPKSSLHNVIAAPMAQLTPIRSNPTPNAQPSRPNILSKESVSKGEDPNLMSNCPINKDNDHSYSIDARVDSTADKRKLTSEITKLLAGQKSAPNESIPSFKPGSLQKSLKYGLKQKVGSNQAPNEMPSLQPGSNQPPNEMPPLQPIASYPNKPKQVDITVPGDASAMVSESDIPTYTYVLCPSSANQSVGMPFGGQTFVAMDTNSTIANSTTSFILKNQAESKSSTTMPGSIGPNQFIINQQINTGGVVINPQAGGVPGSSLMFNKNIEASIPGVQESQILQTFRGLQKPDGEQMYYILMPSTQVETTNQNVQLQPTPQPQILPRPQLVQQPTVTTNKGGFKMQKDIGVPSKVTKKGKKKTKDVNKVFILDKTSNSNFNKISNPNLPNVTSDITTLDDSYSSEPVAMSSIANLWPGETTEEDNNKSIFENPLRSDSKFQMPIISGISTGGIDINLRASGVPGSSVVFNKTVDGLTPGEQESQIVQTISGLQGTDGGQMFYIVMPSTQVESTNQNVQLQSTPQSQISPHPELVQRQTVTTNKNSVKVKNLGVPSKVTKKSKKMAKDVNKVFVLDKISNSNFHNISKPNLPNVTPDITTVDDSNSSEPGATTEEDNNESFFDYSLRSDGGYTMPIITSIGTVADDSKNIKEKVRRDPVSVYESEFARFLEQNVELKKKEEEDSKEIVHDRKNRVAYDPLENSKAIKSLKVDRIGALRPIAPKLTSNSNDYDVILLDDNSSSNESVSKGGTETSKNTPLVNVGNQYKGDTQTKPKIFLKKLSDLLSSSQPTMQQFQITENPPSSSFQHCCLRCNTQLKDWYELRIHLKSKHNIYACVYGGCSIFNSLDEYRIHILQTHHCVRCSNDFGDLPRHQQDCSVEFQTTGVQSLEGNQDESKRKQIRKCC